MTMDPEENCPCIVANNIYRPPQVHIHSCPNESTMVGTCTPWRGCTTDACSIRYLITYDKLCSACVRIVRYSHHTRSYVHIQSSPKRQIVRVLWSLRLTTTTTTTTSNAGIKRQRTGQSEQSSKRLWYRVACSSTWTMQGRWWRVAKETNLVRTAVHVYLHGLVACCACVCWRHDLGGVWCCIWYR